MIFPSVENVGLLCTFMSGNDEFLSDHKSWNLENCHLSYLSNT